MSEGRPLCWRCHRPIATDQPSETYPKISLPSGGADIRLHERCPKAPAYVRRFPA